eukprot:Opistho-1_new@37427
MVNEGGIRDCLLPIDNSPLTTAYSQLTTHDSRLTLHVSRLKKDPHGLIEPLIPRSRTGLLHLFIVALEAKEAGHIAVAEGNFEVTSRIEPGQFLRFANGGIVIADGVDGFVAFEYDLKTPALPLLVKFFAGDIDDHILEIIDEQNLSLHPVGPQCGAEWVFLFNVGNRYTIVAYTARFLDIGYCKSQFLGNFQQCLVFIDIDADQFCGFGAGDHGQDAVIRTDNILILVPGHQHISSGRLEQVHNDQVKSARRIIAESIVTGIGRLRKIGLGKIMRDIADIQVRHQVHELPLDGTNKIIPLAYIRSQR